jgi:hypothetical protein
MSLQSFTLHGFSVSARPYFVDSNARDERVALRHLLRVVEICRVDDREAGNGVGTERKVLRSALRDFAAIAEAAHVYGMWLGCLKPFAPGGRDFRGGFFKSVMALYPAGGVVYRIRYFALLGCQWRRASVLVLTAVIYLEGPPVLELKSGPMTSALGTFETCRRSL